MPLEVSIRVAAAERQVDGDGIVIGNALRNAMVQRPESAAIVRSKALRLIFTLWLGEIRRPDEHPVEFVMTHHAECLPEFARGHKTFFAALVGIGERAVTLVDRVMGLAAEIKDAAVGEAELLEHAEKF